MVRDGTVYLFDRTRAAALELATGKPLWTRSLEEFGPPAPGPRTYFYATAGPGVLALVHEFQAVRRPGDPEGFRDSEPGRRLVVLRASNGSTVWSRGGRDDPSEGLRRLLFTGPPVVVRDRLFIAGKVEERAGSENEAYCAAFELETGRLLWRTFLCSAPRPEAGREVFPEGPTLAYGEGWLFCGTGMGILSSIDPDTGEQRWAFFYERAPHRNFDGSILIRSYRESWSDNPMILREGRIYATPGDSPYLHVLLAKPDGASGLVRLARLEKSGYRYLIGVKDRTLFLAGRDDRRRYHVVSAFHPEGGERCNLWDFPVPNPVPGRQGAVDLPRGRALLCDDRIYLPTTKGMYVLDASRGDLLAQIAPAGGGPFDPGNLLVAGDRLLTANRLGIRAYRAKER